MALAPIGPSSGQTAGTAPTPPIAGDQLTDAQRSAKAQLTATLGAFGLDTLGDFVWNEYLHGVPVDQIMLDIRGTKEYKARFPAMEELAKRGQAITESQYVQYEASIYSLAQANGLPKGMYTTPDQIAKMLVNGVSVSEAQDRMAAATYAATTAPASIRTAMQMQWGVQPGGLVALYLDSDKSLPLLKQEWAAASVAGAAIDQGLSVGKDEALALAAKGIDYNQASQGFGEVASTQGLGKGFGETAGQDIRTAAAFGDAAAQRTVQRVQRGRLVQFKGGGGAAEGSTGVTGLGASSTG